MMRLRLIACMAMLAGCSTASTSGQQFTSLEQVITTGLNADPDTRYPTEMLPSLNACAARSIVDGIPASDQAIMLAALNRHQLTPEADALFVKWTGRSMQHGKVQDVSIGDPSSYAGGKARFEDGTPAPDISADIDKHFADNAKRICPLLVEKYPDFFRP